MEHFNNCITVPLEWGKTYKQKAVRYKACSCGYVYDEYGELVPMTSYGWITLYNMQGNVHSEHTINTLLKNVFKEMRWHEWTKERLSQLPTS